MPMNLTKTGFGTTGRGEAVSLYRLTNGRGAYVELLDYGCTVRALVLPDRAGRMTDVVLGYDSLAEYEENDGYLGAVVGRFANRIGAGRLTVAGRDYQLAVNNGPNHLHGGLRGFDKYVWDAAADETGVTFSRLSPDGEEGYPGALRVSVRYSWDDGNALTIRYTAETDAPTALNLTNHSYFNLNGGGSALGHRLIVAADRFTENDLDCLPTGRILEMDDCPVMDFRAEKTLGRDIGAADHNLKNGAGYDHNYILRAPGLEEIAARVVSDRSGIAMVCRTTQPGVQLYSANFLTDRAGKNGARYAPRDALCLETQHFPDGVAHGFAPAPLLRPGERFDQTTVYQFGLARDRE